MVNKNKPVVFGSSSTSDRVIELSPGERILLAGLHQGVPLPYECATGTCGQCRAQVLSGGYQVIWPDAPGIAKLDANEILMCQTTIGEGTDRLHLSSQSVSHSEINPGKVGYQNAEVLSIELVDEITAVVELKISEKFTFSGGQFLLVGIPGIAGYRAYSIANYPAIDGVIRFVIRKKDEGKMSTWFFNDGNVGETIEVFGPLGSSFFNPETDNDFVIIVGGSGISVAMGVIEHALFTSFFDMHSVTLYFGVKSRSDALFAEKLENYIKRSGGNLKVIIAFSEDSAPNSLQKRHPLLGFDHGLVHEVFERAINPGRRFSSAFLAGPEPMIDAAVRVLVLSSGVSPTDIHFDKFS